MVSTTVFHTAASWTQSGGDATSQQELPRRIWFGSGPLGYFPRPDMGVTNLFPPSRKQSRPCATPRPHYKRKEPDEMPRHTTRTVASDENSALAYKLWLARCFRDGSPEEDLFRAICVNSMKPGGSSRPRQPNTQGRHARRTP